MHAFVADLFLCVDTTQGVPYSYAKLLIESIRKTIYLFRPRLNGTVNASIFCLCENENPDKLKFSLPANCSSQREVFPVWRPSHNMIMLPDQKIKMARY